MTDVSRATYVLTPREQEVFDRLVTYGESNKMIAAALGCAERTIDKHMERIMTKTGIHSRCKLMAGQLEKGEGQ